MPFSAASCRCRAASSSSLDCKQSASPGSSGCREATAGPHQYAIAHQNDSRLRCFAVDAVDQGAPERHLRADHRRNVIDPDADEFVGARLRIGRLYFTGFYVRGQPDIVGADGNGDQIGGSTDRVDLACDRPGAGLLRSTGDVLGGGPATGDVDEPRRREPTRQHRRVVVGRLAAAGRRRRIRHTGCGRDRVAYGDIGQPVSMTRRRCTGASNGYRSCQRSAAKACRAHSTQSVAAGVGSELMALGVRLGRSLCGCGAAHSHFAAMEAESTATTSRSTQSTLFGVDPDLAWRPPPAPGRAAQVELRGVRFGEGFELAQ